MKTLIATLNDEGRTIYKYLLKMFPDLPLSKIEKLFRKKDIKINNQRTNDKKYCLKKGDVIVIYGIVDEAIKSKETVHKATEINFKVIYEDENVLVVDKKQNVAVHSEENSLDDQVLKYLKFKQKDSFVPSHIGRLDKSTSGLMVYAKNYSSLVEMKEKQSNFKKIYVFKSDIVLEKQQKVSFFLDKNEEKHKMKVVDKPGLLAETIFFAENGKKYAQLITGRKHQIRVSLSKLGYPILGDKKYGGRKSHRVFLHSHRLQFKGLSGNLEYLNNQEFISYPDW
ncbi:RluA family pseudouridine synthase [Mycoplasma procyoni]|uniref:RluA family pseudouridine synthase n=1 Tax=Mycoplasma procyoni TaxID=568784 RepID=UPI00197B6EAB|nr:RluA family pseudouridine synthase [Mycoplasma procyoni]MBN3535055.1 RluA family pseudouridine synthase [Mycoplasma procyoni]